ncbi:response regulator [Effusibacillus consociatus]|uniref:Response regulator n=1 Tax=Effusibacillus consociatus TaxID=1117041 RepID=A0ABV9Q6W3_9BACL
MKVLIVDESTVAYGNISLLVERLGIEVVGNATTEREIESTIARHQPELVLIDTRCSYLQGPDTIRKIKRLNPGTNVVAISVFEDQQDVKQIFESGISDIITKPIESERLIDSLRRLGLLQEHSSKSLNESVNVEETVEEAASVTEEKETV